MNPIEEMLSQVTEKLKGLARANAVVAKPISVGDRHAVPLCELSYGFGGGGGQGESTEGEAPGQGVGGGAGAGVKTGPVAVLVIKEGRARLEGLGQ